MISPGMVLTESANCRLFRSADFRLFGSAKLLIGEGESGIRLESGDCWKKMMEKKIGEEENQIRDGEWALLRNWMLRKRKREDEI
ncbi:unnamed protein product [Cuscuta campestris]|nr:unnamed protein product [Cuscuta campestris]